MCGWENGWRGVHQKPHSNLLTPNMFENLGRPADLENQECFILMLQPLGLVVSWPNTNEPSCWHVIASLSQGYDVGHVRVVQREGVHSELNAAKVVVASAATLVNDIFEQTGMHPLKISIAMMPRLQPTDPCRQRLRSDRRQGGAGRLRSWTCEPSTPCTATSQSGERHTKATRASSATSQTSST